MMLGERILQETFMLLLQWLEGMIRVKLLTLAKKSIYEDANIKLDQYIIMK